MTKAQGITLLVILFILSAASTFYIDDHYRKLVRYLYCIFTDNKISFHTPRKYFHLVSDAFAFSFGLFTSSSAFLLNYQSQKQKTRNILLAIIFLAASFILICYLDSNIKLIECTACQDGTRVLFYNDINYDKIFICSLTIAFLPILVTDIIRRYKTRKSHSFKDSLQ